MSDHVGHVRQELRGCLRDKGLRATGSRLAVLVCLHDAAGPRTHEQVMEDLGAGAFDRATVYRILSDLSESGLLRRMDLGDHVWRYELQDACRDVSDDHAHFLCEDCGEVTCLPPVEIRAVSGVLPAILRGAEVRLRVSGRCGDCATA